MWRVRTFFQRQELSNRSQVNKAIEKQRYEEVKENKHHTGTTNYPLNLVLHDLISTNWKTNDEEDNSVVDTEYESRVTVGICYVRHN